MHKSHTGLPMMPSRIAKRFFRFVVATTLWVFAVGTVYAAGSAELEGVWDLISVSTRWPDDRVTEPWGATPVGRITYGADGRMSALLMDAGRNQADGRVVAPEIKDSAAAYYGKYTVDPVLSVVTHYVDASLRASESGAIERSYMLSGDTLLLIAEALFEGSQVTHTLTWRRAADD